VAVPGRQDRQVTVGAWHVSVTSGHAVYAMDHHSRSVKLASNIIHVFQLQCPTIFKTVFLTFCSILCSSYDVCSCFVIAVIVFALCICGMLEAIQSLGGPLLFILINIC